MTPAIRPEIAALPGSKIRAVARAGQDLKDIIPLWFGEGDAMTPSLVRDAAKAALDAGETFYAANKGVPPLVEALRDYLRRLYGVELERERLTVTASGMNAIMLCVQAVCGAGDNVVLHQPLWPNLAETVRVMGGEPRAVPLDNGPLGWSLDLDRLMAACDSRTRAIFVNSPNNPTGWMMAADQQRALLDFCRRRGIWLIADEVYGRIVYDRKVAPSFLTLAEDGDPLLVVNSFSKAWLMTGWRLGWIVAPSSLSDTFEKLSEYNLSHPTTFVQHGGIAALRNSETITPPLVAGYAQARDLCFQRLAAMKRVRLARPEAAFYAFMQVDGAEDSLALAIDLLRKARVGLAPGVAFGPSGEGWLRLCFATTLPRLTEAMDRLAPVLDA